MTVEIPRPLPKAVGAMHLSRCNIAYPPCPERPVMVFNTGGISDPACVIHAAGDYIMGRLTSGHGKLLPFTPEQREAIEVAWAPEPEKPDITIPATTNEQERTRVPLGMTVTVDGVKYQLVQWFNFLGWEVRKLAKDAFSGEQQKAIGWLTETYSGGARANRKASAGTSGTRYFPRIDEAIRWLATPL